MSDIDAVDLILDEIGLMRRPLTQIEFDIDGQKQSVYIPVELDQDLSEEDIESAYEMLEIADMARSSPFYEDWKEDTRPVLEKYFFDSGVAERVMLSMWIRALEHWQDEFQVMSEDEQYQRIRRFKPDLVHYDSKNDSHIVEIDENALVIFVEDFISAKAEEIIHPWINYSFDLMLTYGLEDVLNTPEENQVYHERIRNQAIENGNPEPTDEDFQPNGCAYEHIILLRWIEAIDKLSMEDYDSIVSGFSQQASDLISQLCTLEQIENRILRFTSDLPSDSDETISKGDIPVSINEGLIGIIEKSWQLDQDGQLCYETEPLEDGLTVKLKLSNKSSKLFEQIEESINPLEEIDQLTISLNRILQIQAEHQKAPWQDTFIIDLRYLVDQLSLGRIGRKSKADKIKEIIKRLVILQQIQICFYWTGDMEETSLMPSNLWHFKFMSKVEANQDFETSIPKSNKIEVRAGEWARQCNAEVNKHRNLLWVGYQPKNRLKQRASLKSQLEAVYYQLQQDQFTVYDWLVRAKSRPKIEQLLKNRYSKKDLKKAFKSAITDLQSIVKPTFDIQFNSNNWLQNRVVKRRPKVEPVSISEHIHQLRLEAGLTQAEVGKIVGYDRSRISQLEGGSLVSDDAARRVKSALSQLTKQNINTPNVKG
ncbi:MAG: helix-turn-helix domain-containing protein [Spirulina sp. SIO3F2]|nr:helix-turn-helix domain-containing protein [Spirulina sp. SIO3F2]